MTDDEIQKALDDARELVTHGELNDCSPLGAAIAGLGMIIGFCQSHGVDTEKFVEALRTGVAGDLLDHLRGPDTRPPAAPMTELPTSARVALHTAARAYINHWLGDDPAMTDALEKSATEELFQTLRSAYELGTGRASSSGDEPRE